MQPIFITGIGTGIGKTLVSAIVAHALSADYWKPVQAGTSTATDSEWIESVLGKTHSTIFPEAYQLALAASPHLAAKAEGVKINLTYIADQLAVIQKNDPARYLVIEGAGGLLVPLNEKEFVADLVKELGAKVILVSRNYLGSINHSLLTAASCLQRGIEVIGWIFNDQYLNYEEEIVTWSGVPKIASIPFSKDPQSEFVIRQAELIRPALLDLLNKKSTGE